MDRNNKTLHRGRLALSLALAVSFLGTSPSLRWTWNEQVARVQAASESLISRTPAKELKAHELLGISSKRINELDRDYESFLHRIGMWDISGEARKTLNENKSLDKIPKFVLETNAETYQITESARKISEYITSRLIPQLNGETGATAERQGELKNKALLLAQRLWTLRPLEGEWKYPNNIETIGDDTVRNELKFNDAHKVALRNADSTLDSLVADILETVYGTKMITEILEGNSAEKKAAFLDEKAELEKVVKVYVLNLYENPELGSTKWLARALGSSLVRYSRLQKKVQGAHADLEPLLSNKMRAVGENLSNYITDVVQYVDAHGKTLKMKVETGDVVNESSKEGLDSFKMSSAVFPQFFKSFSSYVRSIRLQMWANPLYLKATNDIEKIKAKIEKGEKVTLKDRFDHFITQRPEVLLRSYTHAGMAFVFHDAETGMSVPMIADRYPNAGGPGGVRWVGFEGFGALNPKFARFGITKLSWEKMQKQVQESLSQKGFNEVFLKGNRLDVQKDSDGTVYYNENSEVEETLKYSREEQAEIEKAAREMSPQEFEAWGKSRLYKIAVRDTVGTEAKGFAIGFVNGVTAQYCSQGDWVWYKEATYADIMVPSRYSLLHIYMKNKGAKGAEEINLKRVPIPPNVATVNAPLAEKNGVLILDNPDYDNTQTERITHSLSSRSSTMSLKLARQLAPYKTQNFNNDYLYMNAQQNADALTWARGEKESGLFGYNQYTDFSNRGEELIRERKENDGSTVDKPNAVKADSKSLEKSFTESSDWIHSLRNFMMEVGLPDLSAEIRKTMEKEAPLHPKARDQQTENIRIYNSINASRELALLFLQRVHSRLDNPNAGARIAEFTARVLALQPRGPDRQIRPDLLALPEKTEEQKEHKERLITEEHGRILKTSIEQTTRDLTGEFLRMIYGEKVAAYLNGEASQGTAEQKLWQERIQKDAERIYLLAGQYVKNMYMETQAGSTRWLGRALATGLARISEMDLQKQLAEEGKAIDKANYLNHPNMKTLAHELRNQGMQLEQFLGDQLIVTNTTDAKEAVRTTKIKIKTGDYALYRADNGEAAAIAGGWSAGDWRRALRLGLKGWIVGTPLHVSTEELRNGFTWWEQLLHKKSRSKNKLTEGYSHVGIFELKEAKSFVSKIKTILVVDNYPTPVADDSGSLKKPGGMRMTGTETFNDPSHDTALGIAQVDRGLLGKLVYEKIIKDGLPKKNEIVLPAHTMKLDSEERPIPPMVDDKGQMEKPDTGWRYEGNSEETLKMVELVRNKKMSYSQFGDYLAERVSKQREKMIKEGVIFQWVYPLGAYIMGTTHCTQAEAVAWFREFGIDIEFIRSKPATVTQMIGVLGKWVLGAEQAKALRNVKPWKSFWKIMKGKLDPVVQSAVLLKMPRIWAPVSLMLQPFVRDEGIHRVQIAPLSPAAKALSTMGAFRGNAEINTALSKLLPENRYYTAKTLDSLDVIAASHHWRTAQIGLNAYNGFTPELQVIERMEKAISAIEKRTTKLSLPKANVSPVENQGRENTLQKSDPLMCVGVFKKAG